MENDIQQLSFGEKVGNFFTHPSRLFEQYKDKPTFWLKLIVYLITSVVVTVISTIKNKPAVEQYMNETLKKVNDPQAAEIVKKTTEFTTSPAFVSITGLIGLIIVILIGTLIYWGLTRLLKGELKFTQMLAIYTLANIPIVIGSVIKSTYMLAANHSVVADKYHITYANTLMNNLDIFVIWQIVMLIIGISTVSGISKKKSAALVIILNIILIGVSLLITAVSINNMQAVR